MGIERARKYRRARASALARIAVGQLSLREAVIGPHKALRTCPVYLVLYATPSVGPETARKVLERADVWPLLPLQDLSDEQRVRVCNELPKRVI